MSTWPCSGVWRQALKSLSSSASATVAQRKINPSPKLRNIFFSVMTTPEIAVISSSAI
jgi:hypothetical protein